MLSFHFRNDCTLTQKIVFDPVSKESSLPRDHFILYVGEMECIPISVLTYQASVCSLHSTIHSVYGSSASLIGSRDMHKYYIIRQARRPPSATHTPAENIDPANLWFARTGNRLPKTPKIHFSLFAGIYAIGLRSGSALLKLLFLGGFHIMLLLP